SRRRHTRFKCDWSSDVCSSDLLSYASSRESNFFMSPPRNYTLKFDNVLSPPTMKWDLRPCMNGGICVMLGTDQCCTYVPDNTRDGKDLDLILQKMQKVVQQNA